MESSHPFPIGPGGRVLAAIVFTDVVSFSARVQLKEDSTLNLVERDFAVMANYCERFSGSVLKSTGDGLLLYFSSAVHAVGCALKIQRSFAERAKAEPAGESLCHRIGIHLGDVFAREQDVMGDGVNIAARLQSVADPGGICISQTVYDVVRNKLELDVERMAPRDLKNISNNVPIYRLLLEPRKANPVPNEFRPPVPDSRPAFSRAEKLGAMGLLVLAIAGVALLVFQQNERLKTDLPESEMARAALDREARQDAVSQNRAASQGAGHPSPDPAGEFNFAAMALGPPSGKSKGDSQDALVQQKAESCANTLISWTKNEIERRYSKDAPLFMHPGKSLQVVFAVPTHRFVIALGGAVRPPQAWENLKLDDQEAIIVRAMLNSPGPLPREVALGADAFAYLHKMPEMVRTLHPGLN